MLTPEEKQNITKKTDELKKEIIEIRQSLNQFNEQKETLFNERKKIGKNISDKKSLNNWKAYD